MGPQHGPARVAESSALTSAHLGLKWGQQAREGKQIENQEGDHSFEEKGIRKNSRIAN